jgi:hypothetical protein
MSDSGEFNIEIDAEEGLVVITTAQGVPYTYTVEELEGKGVLLILLYHIIYFFINKLFCFFN